jgi:photosystem II stability/assembly factor-like uncharacterized protein
MNKLIVFIWLMVSLLSGIMTSPLFSQSWERQAEGLATRWQKIDAVDSNVAVAIAWTKVSDGRQGIFRTLDGGRSWHEIPWIEQRIGGMVDISITDSLNFWVLTPFSIDHTSDGGRTWEQQHAGDSTTSWFNYIEMFDSVNGIAMGDALPNHPILILKTTDGGKNWESQNQSYFINASCLDIWRGIDFVAPDIGFGRFTLSGVPSDSFFLQKTIDGGRTWIPTSLAASKFTLIRFFDEKLGIAAGKANYPIYRTTDGGNSWNGYSLNITDEGWPMDIEFFPEDPSKVIAAFYKSTQLKHLLFSSDTGKSWVEILTPDIGQFCDIKMVDNKHGWIVGEQGIIHTSTEGVTSVINKKLIPEEFVLYQNFPNPFNSATIIRFNLSHRDVVNLKVYNLVGEEVAALLNKQLCQAGHHSVKFNSKALASGIYFYQLATSRNITTKRMIIIK